jgi:hypothetical protein
MVKLEWTENRPPTKDVCRYDHCIAETPFGRFLLTWKGWKTDWRYDLGFDETPWDGIEYHSWGSIDEAKQWAADEMEKRIKLLLGEQPTELNAPVATRIERGTAYVHSAYIDMYTRLASLSKHLESSGRIDQMDHPDAYETILDAMNFVQKFKD